MSKTNLLAFNMVFASGFFFPQTREQLIAFISDYEAAKESCAEKPDPTYKPRCSSLFKRHKRAN